ncbi:MAG: MFS transporter [Methanocorpusculum sp.]|nr:MFS transporter [Methanocorpusculum sp.]
MKSEFKPNKGTLIFLLFASTLVMMGGAAVAPALPLMSEAFPEVSNTIISLIVTLPSLAIALSGFFIGALADKIGRTPVLAVSLAVFTLAGISACFLNSFTAILVGRIILGLGIAGISVSTTALITDYYQGLSRTKVLGYQGAAMGIGALILETSGGLLAFISWRTTFLIYLIGLAILIGVLITMREPAREKIMSEKSTVKLPVASITLVYLTIFLDMLVFFILPSKLPYLIESINGESTIASGVLLGFMGCFVALMGILYWRIASKISLSVRITSAFAVLGLGCVVLGLSANLAGITIGVILTGIGSGFMVPTVVNWLTSLVPQSVMGKVSGGYSVAFMLGQFFSSLLAAVILVFAVTYSNMFLVFGALALITAFIWGMSLIFGKKSCAV